MTTTIVEHQDPRLGRWIEACLWAAAVTGIYWAGTIWPAATPMTSAAVAVISMVAGARQFIIHGGNRVTPLGLFALGCAILVGYGGFLTSFSLPFGISATTLSLILASSVFAQVVICGLVPSPAPVPPDHAPTIGASQARIAVIFGGVVLAALALGGPYVPDLRQFSNGAAFTASLLVVAGVILARGRELRTLRVILAGAAFFAYLEFFQDGTGRLRVVALACCALVLLSTRARTVALKWITLMVTPVALWLLVLDRQVLESQLDPSGPTNGGLDSMLASTEVFSRLVNAQQAGYPLGWGTSFLTPIFTVLPADLRPSWMPNALGYELVGLVAPNRVNTGFSTVASVFGEWWWDFSMWGILLAIVVLSILLLWIGGRLSSATNGLHTPHLVRIVFWTMLVGSLNDLVWSGTHTWIVRNLTRLPVLLVFALVQSFLSGQPEGIADPDANQRRSLSSRAIRTSSDRVAAPSLPRRVTT